MAQGPKEGKLIRRDLRTGREVVLRDGPKGSCAGMCSWDGGRANGPVETAISGNHYAHRWTFFGGPEGAGVDSTDIVYRGDLRNRRRTGLTFSFVDGAGEGTASYRDTQQFGPVTQLAIGDYGVEKPKPGERDYLIRHERGKWSSYKDPAGRRIVAASATPTTLWLVVEAKQAPADRVADDALYFCSEPVGGCVVESIPLPAFTPDQP